MVKEDMLNEIVNKAIELGKEGVLGLKHCCMDYAKDQKINEPNRKIFYAAVDEVERRSLADLEFDISKIKFDEIEEAVGNGELNGIEGEYMPIEDEDQFAQYISLGELNGMNDDDYVDPYENLTEEELIQKLPPYFNKTNKQKKKFFKNLNKTFLKNLNSLKSNKKRKNANKLQFDLKNNVTVKFKKNELIKSN